MYTRSFVCWWCDSRESCPAAPVAQRSDCVQAAAVLVPVAVMVGVTLFMLLTVRLDLYIDHDTGCVEVRYTGQEPLKLYLQDITHLCAVQYAPVRDYGGHGVRSSVDGSTAAYTVRGKRGVLITTVGGLILIGSQCPDLVVESIRCAKNDFGLRTSTGEQVV